jgi:hypothetical protein
MICRNLLSIVATVDGWIAAGPPRPSARREVADRIALPDQKKGPHRLASVGRGGKARLGGPARMTVANHSDRVHGLLGRTDADHAGFTRKN